MLPSFAQTDSMTKIEFDSASYFTKKMSCFPNDDSNIEIPENKKATITVSDLNANKFNDSIDRIKVYISSDTDPRGIVITGYETHLNSGVFEGTALIDEHTSAQNRIHVSDGDSLYAKYISTKIYPDNKTNSSEITTSSIIGVSCPPLERVPAKNLRILDFKGQPISLVGINQQSQIVIDLENIQDREQPFAYIVQIQDSNGVTISLSWLAGLLEPKQTLTSTQSWEPFERGTYKVQIFVWERIDNPNALTPPLELGVKVI